MTVNRLDTLVIIPEKSEWIGAATLFDGYSVFTDGSKMDTGTGSGVYIPDRNIKHHIDYPTTVVYSRLISWQL